MTKTTAPLTACPRCGCEAYYRLVRISGKGKLSHRFDGNKELTDNTHLHDCLTYTESKTMYCEDCHTPVGRAGDAYSEKK